jgi:hypothetical protein
MVADFNGTRAPASPNAGATVQDLSPGPLPEGEKAPGQSPQRRPGAEKAFLFASAGAGANPAKLVPRHRLKRCFLDRHLTRCGASPRAAALLAARSSRVFGSTPTARFMPPPQAVKISAAIRTVRKRFISMECRFELFDPSPARLPRKKWTRNWRSLQVSPSHSP